MDIPRFASSLPWFMWDLTNKQLITSGTIPEGEIKDSKSVVITETPIPGRNFQPISVGGNGNRKLAFTLPVLSRAVALGNVGILKQFDMLRNQPTGLLGVNLKGQFTPNPKVLYSWGTGSIPLVYYVSSLSFAHRADMVNLAGFPTYTKVEIELTLDETDDFGLYKMEEAFRSIAGPLIGQVQGISTLGVV